MKKVEQLYQLHEWVYYSSILTENIKMYYLIYIFCKQGEYDCDIFKSLTLAAVLCLYKYRNAWLKILYKY